MRTIDIARDFSAVPGGRFQVMGPASGEQFRNLLKRELQRNPAEVLEVVLDGVEGYGSSFLEEAFGGLIRLRIISPADAARRIRIRAKTKAFETYAEEAKFYMDEAAGKL